MDTTTTTYDRPKYLTRLYTIEAWKGLECVWWRSGNQARSVAARAAYGVLDLGADRIIVNREAETTPVATWQATGGWRFGPTIVPALRAALEEGGL